MLEYVKVTKEIYTFCKEEKLKLILCIPYYYDTLGFPSELEELIDQCDEIAIMNYYKKKEAKHIENEVFYAKKHRKKISVIYELKKVGTHSLKEINTYANEGMEGVEKSFEKLESIYEDVPLSYAIHDAKAWKGLNDE
ncbi:MAG: hypothetical protein GX666_07180 [Tissierellia bacterium]|nr:hypothetical protein [Tissierellia bacterium]